MSKSYFMSIAIHASLFLGALSITPPLIENKIPEVVVELVDSSSSLSSVEPAPAEAAPAVSTSSALMSETEAGLQPVPAEEIAHEEIIQQASATAEAKLAEEVAAPAPKPAPKATPKLAEKKVAKASPKASVKAAPKAKIQVASRAPVPETLEDIEPTDLNYDAVEVAAAGTFNENDLDQDFDQIDQKNQKQVMTQKSQLDDQLQNLHQDMDQELSNIENENQQKAQARAEALEATRTANAKKLAEIKAGEEAAAREAALKAAREQAAQQRAAEIAAANADRAQAAAAAQAERQNAARAGRGTGAPSGSQAGSVSDGKGSSSYASGNGTVRSIENLQQLPGNPKPSYSVDERFRREQGTVIFHAFVTPEGRLQDFKLVQSTGYGNLDQKTLTALKKWRFKPGQQGWVEIPQTWNLKGDAEEMPATLRRSLTQK